VDIYNNKSLKLARVGNGRMGEWENGGMGEWENGRMGEWGNGGMKDYLIDN
jgi:hypothetical protein